MHEAELKAAHEHSWKHRQEVESSTTCGCYFCLATFAPSDITEWIDEGSCAMCPRCGIDAVLGDASGLPVSDDEFLLLMRREFFGLDDIAIPTP
ncbi:cytoplasmic protein [Devosia sp. ZB163]|uniref:cytoplasmic protein n=1 Tax=Devosia sp. ZB163 TaxID=3025938 RepID=UPI002361B00D|nr:cytoplasmic protein [Devosia sp. ZB163]MDC9825045.1 cytoplasmic protein [Devosia sp. ZB163]